jgi:hypothetical protein
MELSTSRELSGPGADPKGSRSVCKKGPVIDRALLSAMGVLDYSMTVTAVPSGAQP